MLDDLGGDSCQRRRSYFDSRAFVPIQKFGEPRKMKLLFHVESSLSLRNDPMEIILFFEIRGNGFLDSIQFP